MNDQILTGEVLRLAFGGQGIVHHNSFVVFIPFTAPGDLIKYRIVQRKKNFAAGEVVEIIRPSLHRTTPSCPYFGTCGGCQLQHLNYAAQLEHKRQCIQDTLQRQAHLTDAIVSPVVAARQQWAYRRRISLTLKPTAGHFIAGYTAVDHHSILPVEQCPIFVAPADPVIVNLQEIAKMLISKDENQGKVTILKQGDNTYLLHFNFKTMPQNAGEVLKEAAHRYPAWKGILAAAPGKTLQFGELETKLDIEGLSFTFSPRAFIQNHPEQSLNIYDAICAYAKDLCRAHILDLYCGVGISSLLLAKEGLPVTGVETNQEAIRLAKDNARRNAILRVNFMQADVQNVILGLLKKFSPDMVIVNPPREGLDPKVVAALIEHAPANVLYVSCMPPTLARDIKLLNNKYRLSSVEAYDMFPQTSHVETLAVLKRN